MKIFFTFFKLPYECIFRSEQYALLENACREYLFICDFYMMQDKFAYDLFYTIFGKTIHFYQVFKIYFKFSN